MGPNLDRQDLASVLSWAREAAEYLRNTVTGLEPLIPESCEGEGFGSYDEFVAAMLERLASQVEKMDDMPRSMPQP